MGGYDFHLLGNFVSDEASVTERCIQMAGLLKKLRGLADEEDSARIDGLIKAVSFPFDFFWSAVGVSVLLVLE